MKHIRTLLIDDDQQFLKTATWFLTTEPHYHVVASIATVADIRPIIAQHELDLLLIDLQLVLNNTVEFRDIMHTLATRPITVLMSIFDSEQCRLHAQRLGADDCIAKAHFADEIARLSRTFFTS